MAESERYKAGAAVMEKLFGRPPKPGAMQEGFYQITVENLFGDIWNRPGLELAERSMITLAALTVLGRENELKIHLYGAKNLGIPRAKVEEMMIHLAHYGGWPVAVSALKTIEHVYSKK
jgi:4-carboxymuconolactone decarboxylase